MALRLQVPEITCADCGDQLGLSGIFLFGTEALRCGFCTHARSQAGAIGYRCVVATGRTAGPRRAGWAGEGEPFTQDDSARLLLQLGAEVHGTYFDRSTGQPATHAEVLRAALT